MLRTHFWGVFAEMGIIVVFFFVFLQFAWQEFFCFPHPGVRIEVEFFIRVRLEEVALKQVYVCVTYMLVCHFEFSDHQGGSRLETRDI